jgi:hypothetical protein
MGDPEGAVGADSWAPEIIGMAAMRRRFRRALTLRPEGARQVGSDGGKIASS